MSPLDERDLEGLEPAGWGATLAMIAGPPLLFATLLFSLGFMVGRCSVERQATPVLEASPAPRATASSSSSATSSAKVVGSNRVRIAYTPPQAAQDGPGQAITLQAGGTEPPSVPRGPAAPPGSFEIIVDQVVEVEATSSASSASSSSSASVAVGNSGDSVDNHARLGLLVAYPVGLAVSYQLGALEVPSWVAGTRLELGLDLEANLDQVGVGLSVGEKAFVSGGGFVGWRGPLAGWYLGVGMRF